VQRERDGERDANGLLEQRAEAAETTEETRHRIDVNPRSIYVEISPANYAAPVWPLQDIVSHFEALLHNNIFCKHSFIVQYIAQY